MAICRFIFHVRSWKVPFSLHNRIEFTKFLLYLESNGVQKLKFQRKNYVFSQWITHSDHTVLCTVFAAYVYFRSNGFMICFVFVYFTPRELPFRLELHFFCKHKVCKHVGTCIIPFRWHTHSNKAERTMKNLNNATMSQLNRNN